jgi:carbamoyltransferase
MTAILGISAFCHDPAAALIIDGEIVAAAQEARFTRRQHDLDFPRRAADYCLAEGGLRLANLDYLGLSQERDARLYGLLESYLAWAPRGFRSFTEAVPRWLKQKLRLSRLLRRQFGSEFRGQYNFANRDESQAASAFIPSPFDEAAILTLDGVGEQATAAFGVGRENRIELTHELRFPHSLGLLYSAFTKYCGLDVKYGEYQLMDLAPYGEPAYVDAIRKHLVDLKNDGSFRLNLDYFNFWKSAALTGRRVYALLGGPPRRPAIEITQREMDLAASVRALTEEIMLRMARHVHEQTRMKNLVLAGGLALNVSANGRILREGPFEQLWVQPAAGDAGCALGAALFIWHQLLDKHRDPCGWESQKGSFLGPAYGDQEICDYLDHVAAIYHNFEEEGELVERVANLIADEKVVGWFQGRMEFGPWGLGARSILGDARSTRLQSIVARKIGGSESFQPLPACVLREHVDEYFEMRADVDSPYLLMAAPVKEDKRIPRPRTDRGVPEQELVGFERLKAVRSVLPAVTHVDCSARIQTVDPQRHGRLYRLLKAFHRRTGCPVLINTSFNGPGEPIVESPMDAYRCFLATDIDALVLGKQLLIKREQPMARQAGRGKYLAEFAPD